jgi:hypothetical protein
MMDKAMTFGTRRFKNVNNILNANIYAYLETSVASDVIRLFTDVSYNFSLKARVFVMASLSSLV